MDTLSNVPRVSHSTLTDRRTLKRVVQAFSPSWVRTFRLVRCLRAEGRAGTCGAVGSHWLMCRLYIPMGKLRTQVVRPRNASLSQPLPRRSARGGDRHQCCARRRYHRRDYRSGHLCGVPHSPRASQGSRGAWRQAVHQHLQGRLQGNKRTPTFLSNMNAT